MATHWKKQLADAHQRSRDLENRIHDLEGQLEALNTATRLYSEKADAAEARAMGYAGELARIESERRRRVPDHRPLSDIELTILAHAMVLETLPETPARRRLIDRLVVAICGDDSLKEQG